jgi:hypothetical protein
VLRHIAAQTKSDQGEGAVAGGIHAALERIAGFELQLGPYAVAQLRLLAEVVELTGESPGKSLHLFVTDTLGNPNDDGGYLPQIFAPIAESRKAANKIKRETPVTVILGNPPYKEKAKGKGGWVETGDPSRAIAPLLDVWQPPKELKAGAHAKHLRNLYIYFWRWASWKVWDHGPGDKTGVVCFITVSGFLNGPGFQQMRAWLRDTCDQIWVVDGSPEGHQPDVSTRIFQGVQQPVCIVLASRSSKANKTAPAQVRFRALPAGRRGVKFDALRAIDLHGEGWTDCPVERYAPFLPASTGAWASYPKLEDLFNYNGSGCQAKRTWVIAPDTESLRQRWNALTAAPTNQKELLFHPTLRAGIPTDRHINSVLRESLPGHPHSLIPLSRETGGCTEPTRYAYRTFDRQWIIPDLRVLTQPTTRLWAAYSDKQLFITAFTEESPQSGPPLTVAGLIPDLHHYKGSFGGRVFPLWADAAASQPNLSPKLIETLASRYGQPVTAEDAFAYIAGIAANPAYTAKFQDDLSTPGLRIPITADAKWFFEVVAIGRRVVWLHSYGERMIDPKQGRPAGPPRVPADVRPTIPKDGAIAPTAPLPDELRYNASQQRLHLGGGFIDHVSEAVWKYQVDGKQVIPQWFSYRKRDRSKPSMGDKRPPSPLQAIQPDRWLAEYTTDLMNLLNVLTLLVELEPQQAALLDKVCNGALLTETELRAADALCMTVSTSAGGNPSNGGKQAGLF